MLSYMLESTLSQTDLSDWIDLLPDQYRILGANLFADAFVADDAGEVHMLEIATGKYQRIASSEEKFWAGLEADEGNWQLRPLVDACRAAGKNVVADRCYAFTISPVFREGWYEEGNVWVSPLSEWLGLSSELYQRIKHMSDGENLKVKVDGTAPAPVAKSTGITGIRRFFGRRSN